MADPLSADRIWQARADTIEGDFPSGTGKLKRVRARLLVKGISAMAAEADEASYQPTQRMVLLRGNVRAAWPAKKAKLHAESVRWSLEKRTLDAHGKIRIDHGQDMIQGNHLHADTELKQLEVTD